MSYLTLNGLPVSEANISLPRVGVWQADVLVDSDAALPESTYAVLNLGGALQLVGTIRQGGSSEGGHHLRLSGGAGCHALPAKPQAYRNSPLRIPLLDALNGAGESLSARSTPSVLSLLLPHWVVMAQPVGAVVANLALAAKAAWRVLPDGSTWIGEETWGRASTAFEVLSESPHKAKARLSLETPNLLPGTTLGGRRVSTVVHHVTADGMTAEVSFES